jgi:hypothetical protein
MAPANSASRIVELGEIISANTAKVNDFLAESGLPQLTFDVDGPADFPVPSANEDISNARRAVVNATMELHDLMVGPRETLRWLAWSVSSSCILH